MDFPAGFGIVGIRGQDKNNFGLIFAPHGMRAAGVFTTNMQAAHPVVFSKEKIGFPEHKALLVNKGSANAATGSRGRGQLIALVGSVVSGLGIDEDSILVASTGVIGQQLEYSDEEIIRLLQIKDKVEPDSFARAIMTTDTYPKIKMEKFMLGDRQIKIAGIAKGSGMIAPDMATMLAFVLTDADIAKDALQEALQKVADVTFNCLSVDGETSTNDSVFLVSSGVAGNNVLHTQDKEFIIFCEYLEKVCLSLVRELAADGEGATKLIKIDVVGAGDRLIAKEAAKAVAISPLCKTAFYGASPNWGRIISALGAAGIEFNIDDFCLDVNDISWVDHGVPCDGSKEEIRELLKEKEYSIRINLNSGTASASYYTCDFSPQYVNINADYLS